MTQMSAESRYDSNGDLLPGRLEMNDADRDAYDAIRAWVHRQVGIYYPAKKEKLLTHRLQKLCHKNGIQGGLSQLAELVQNAANHEIQVLVLNAASTNHTYFFREPTVLNFLRDKVLPHLPKSEPLRFWSAASSSGEEAYTLAIITAEEMGLDWARKNVRILGTDISGRVLDIAEKGEYEPKRFEETSKILLKKYFKKQPNGNYQVIDELKEMVMFRRMNLQSQPYPFEKQFHVVFCRNVLYYFDRENQQKAVNNIHKVVVPGGWLMTSVTESIRDFTTPWKPVQSGIYKKG